MAIGKRIDAATLTVKKETAKALQSIHAQLAVAEGEKLKTMVLKGACPKVIRCLGRLGKGQLPIDDGEVMVAQALVTDMADGISDMLQFGSMANGELTQTIALNGSANWSDLQSFVAESLDHFSSDQRLAGGRR